MKIDDYFLNHPFFKKVETFRNGDQYYFFENKDFTMRIRFREEKKDARFSLVILSYGPYISFQTEVNIGYPEHVWKTYGDHTSTLPSWIRETIKKTMDIVDERDKIRRLFLVKGE